MYQIGVDIGGTNIKVGLVNETMELVQTCSVRFPHDGARSVVKTIEEAVDFLLRQQAIARKDVESVGIVVPGSIDQKGERVIDAYNLGFHDVPLKALAQEAFGEIPVYLANDANGAALAELYAGAFRGCKTAVLFTLGTGLGGGIILGGHMFNGGMNQGVELGHMYLVNGGEHCTCGRDGCWEAYASATALIRQTRQAALAHPESLLAQVEEITGRTAFDAAQQGDATAAEVVARYAVYVAAGLTDFVNILAPEMILVGGGISRQGEALLAPIREYVATHCFGQREGAIPTIAAAKLGNEAGIIGAALLGLGGA